MKITIIDFEAAGLQSYPIELGWATVDLDAGNITAESFLIRPTQDWLENWEWDPEAERIHGISPEQLDREGIDVLDAVARASGALSAGTIYSDAPSYEAFWMGVLFEAGNSNRLRQPIDIQNVANAFNHFPFDPGALRRRLMIREKVDPVHRAKGDAMAWAQIMLDVASTREQRQG